MIYCTEWVLVEGKFEEMIVYSQSQGPIELVLLLWSRPHGALTHWSAVEARHASQNVRSKGENIMNIMLSSRGENISSWRAAVEVRHAPRSVRSLGLGLGLGLG